MFLGEKNEVDYRLFNILGQLIEKEEDKPSEWADYRIARLIDSAAKLTKQALKARDEITEERDPNKKDNLPC